MAKRQPGGSRRGAAAQPNLAAARRALQQAQRALGGEDKAAPLVRSALASVERRLGLQTKPRRGEWGGQIVLVAVESARGRRWQLMRGKRVLKSGPLEALDPQQRSILLGVAELFARQRGAVLVVQLPQDI